MHAIDYSEATYKDLRRRLDPFFADILGRIADYNKTYNKELLQRAYEFGLWAHREQVRKSGEPYFEHCLHVALLLTELRMDSVTIAAALLHDVVEDTGYTREDIAEGFGHDVALLVDGVTKITEFSGIKNLGYESRQAETFRKMLLSMAKDVRVIIIKFADRLHNMRTLQHVPAKNRIRISIETRDVYAPLAHRFGMAKIKSELEDLSFKYTKNKEFTELASRLNQKREVREAYINTVIDPIKADLKAHKIAADVFGRPKHIFSIYRKMTVRSKPFEEIYDLFAIRIIVEKVEECYYVLGIVHNCFTPVYERFKDYIAMPKFNGYQSLHTTIVDKEGHMVEIQIRTQEMHRVAEMGIAAHWLYKDGTTDTKKDEMEQRLDWVRQLLDQYKENEMVDAQDFLESLKINLYQDEVFVFTPQGDVQRLPVGATPVDFAFAVHTNVGMTCIGAKVNGKMVPLKYILQSGEAVEIITSSNQHPSQGWLTFVKTSKARHHVRKFLREEQFEHSVKLGDEIINKYSKRYKVKLDEEKLKEAAQKLNFDETRNLRAAVGRGEVTFEKVASAINQEPVAERKSSIFKTILPGSKKPYAVQVQGMDNVMVHVGKCCHPVPGDDIIGYITRGRGVTIHRKNCPNMQSLVDVKDRTIQVNWTVEVEETFHVQLTLLGEDRQNMIRDLALAIANTNTNILNMDIKSRDKLAVGKLFVEVRNLPHLTRVINAMNQVKGIISVERVESGSPQN
ncbi:MAG: RelA/SpoT family protein [Calditrichia bacterium]